MSWKDTLRRRAEVKAAFVEGLLIGTWEIEPGEPVTESAAWRRSEAGIEAAWKRSRARASLAQPFEPVRYDPSGFRGAAEPRKDPHVHQVGDALKSALAPDE